MVDYQPIACIDHERLEFAVLRRQVLVLHLNDGAQLRGVARDVYTRDGAEWLRFHPEDGAERVLRLDEISHFSQQA